MKKIAIVAGGWHYPLHFYKSISVQHIPHDWELDKFVIGHREPPGLNEEKDFLNEISGGFVDLDKVLYKDFVTKKQLKELGWDYSLEENLYGDFGFTNQWLQKKKREYDIIISCHDDNFIRDDYLIHNVLYNKIQLYEKNESFDIIKTDKDWSILFNSVSPVKRLTIRFPMVFLRKKVIDLMPDGLDLSHINFTRPNIINTPNNHQDLAPWNQISRVFKEFIYDNNLQNEIKYLSPYYRVSKYCIECERGFIHKNISFRNNFIEGMKNWK